VKHVFSDESASPELFDPDSTAGENDMGLETTE
jgi:hypothetical protein